MMRLLGELTRPVVDYNAMLIHIEKIYSTLPALTPKTQIFKAMERHTLKSICYFYTRQYD